MMYGVRLPEAAAAAAGGFFQRPRLTPSSLSSLPRGSLEEREEGEGKKKGVCGLRVTLSEAEGRPFLSRLLFHPVTP